MPDNLLENLRDELCDELGLDHSFDTSGSILVITGQNAAGKSLLRRWFHKELDHRKVEAIHLSQEGRTTEGFVRALVYGSEHHDSTGYISAHTFTAGVRTMRGRSEDKIDHVVIWDEPEIGMGDELQLGSANWLCDELADWPGSLQGVIVMTHSRTFVKRLMEFPKAVWMSMDGFPTHNEWLNREIVPVTPEQVSKVGLERYRRISKLLKKKR